MTAFHAGADNLIAWPPPAVGVADGMRLRAVEAAHAPEILPAGPVGMNWAPFGVVLPVLAGSSGAGASVLSALLVDVLQQAGRCALLVDTAEPHRSGLSAAATFTSPEVAYPARGVAVRWSWRGHAVMAQMETALPAPEPVPPLQPRDWLPPSGLAPLHVTIADLGHAWCGATDEPMTGPAAWLSVGAGSDNPYPILVVRATRPSLLAAEAALARLDPWVSRGQAVCPERMVVMASWRRNKWPKDVLGVAGARVSALLDDAVFIPHDEELLLGGVCECPTPPRAQAAAAELLHEWGLLTSGPATATSVAAKGANR